MIGDFVLRNAGRRIWCGSRSLAKEAACLGEQLGLWLLV